MKNIGKKLNEISHPNDEKMALGKKNYVLMLIGFAIIVVGMLLMMGGKPATAEEFDYSIFSFRRITLAPLVIVAGFVFEIYAILKR